jgi:uncharacterized membrane protein YbhN (UPF0104 family)
MTGVWDRLKPFCMLVVLALALYLLAGTLRKYHYHDIVRVLTSYPARTLVFAALLTGCNYLVLTGMTSLPCVP